MEENGSNSLVDFVSMATSHLKHSLGRPMKPKRKVNHRKYLQRQLKCRSGRDFSQAVSTLVTPIHEKISNVHNAQDGRHSNRNLQGKSPNELVEREIQHTRPPVHGGPVTQKAPKSVPELVDIDQIMSAVRVPTIMNPVKKRKDMLVPRAEPVKFYSKQDQTIPAAKHINAECHVHNSHELPKNGSAELLEWFGPEFDDLLERWSEESSLSSRRAGSDCSSTADPYSPNSDISDNGAAIEDVFYEQLMRFSSTSSSLSGSRAYLKDNSSQHNNLHGYNGVELFFPGHIDNNTGISWPNSAT